MQTYFSKAESSTAKYPLRRVTCKTITIPAGHFDISHEKLFSGQLPNSCLTYYRIVIGLVRNNAFSGSRTHNPFNFQQFGLTEIAVYVDGQQHGQGIKPLKVHYESNLYIRAYNMLLVGPASSLPMKETTSRARTTRSAMLFMLSSYLRICWTMRNSILQKAAVFDLK